MKSSLLLLIGTLCFFKVSGQVVYTAKESAFRKLDANGNVISKSPSKPLKPYTTISLYNNYLVVNTNQNLPYENYKFVRKINITDDEGGHTAWNALDKNNKECRNMIKDYGSYSRIAVIHLTDRYMILYETL